jgi:hypothetical protein
MRSFRWLWLAFAVSCAAPPRVVANQASPTDVHRVVVKHALMTWVMDSPDGQRDKAHDAVKDSKLVEAIEAKKYEIEIRFDAAAGDDVVIERNGREVGRAPLHDVAGGAAPAQILDAL